MYDPQETLRTLDAHRWAVVAVCGAAMLCNYVWFVDALRIARRHRSYSIPPFCVLLWFAHDASFALRYRTWFTTYHHWYPELFWAALVLTAAVGALFLAQILRYGHQDLAPGLTPALYRAGVLATAAGACVVWAYLKWALDDPLYLLSFHLTNVLYPAFGIALTLRRGSRRGQTMLMYAAAFGVSACWFAASVLWLGPQFRTWPWIALGTVTLVWSAAAAAVLHRAPAHRPEAAGAAEAPALVPTPQVG